MNTNNTTTVMASNLRKGNMVISIRFICKLKCCGLSRYKYPQLIDSEEDNQTITMNKKNIASLKSNLRNET